MNSVTQGGNRLLTADSAASTKLDSVLAAVNALLAVLAGVTDSGGTDKVRTIQVP